MDDENEERFRRKKQILPQVPAYKKRQIIESEDRTEY